MNNEETRVFSQIEPHQIRDLVVVWIEDEGRIIVRSKVRDKTFWENHEFLSSLLDTSISLFLTISSLFMLWQHEFIGFVVGLCLNILWKSMFDKHIASPEMETKIK